MSSRARVIAALAGFAGLLAILVIVSGSDRFELKLQLENASGVIKGSPATIGGVPAGEVTGLELVDGGVLATVELDSGQGPFREDLEVAVGSSNLLGSKRIEVSPGSEGRALASGETVAIGEVDTPVELQEVLDVLDGETRMRLSILINEAGRGLTGRSADFNELLARMPSRLDQLTRLVDALAADNQALRRTIEQADRFADRIVDQRSDLGRFIDAAAGTMETIAARRDRLDQTLAEAPAALESARGFLTELHLTTEPLGPAARTLAGTAPELQRALAALPSFTAAAEPTLNAAVAAAPRLTRLAREATPVLRRSRPTLRTLARTSRLAAPVVDMADLALADALVVLEGWARSIQSRDGHGHYFRADVNLSPDLAQSVLSRFIPGFPEGLSRLEAGRSANNVRQARRARERDAGPSRGSSQPDAATPGGFLDAVGDAADELRDAPGGHPGGGRGASGARILDFLVGP